MARPVPQDRLHDDGSAEPAAVRRYGPAAGEPPLLVDPRRWGSLIGLAGGLVFIGASSGVLGPVVSTTARAAGVALVVAALFAHYVRPVSLGPLVRPGPLALAVYCCCVAGELALFAVGSRLLAAAGRGELRPALIATVVGLHFLPFACAFRERMFLYVGGAVAVIGAAGLLVGGLGVDHAADALTVVAGLVMLTVLASYARGRFAPAHAREAA
jgi:hypothetical protein